ATPYFVPDDALVDALKFASLRGIDVRILVPEKSNHWFSDIAAGALLRELAESGVGVYRFQPRMLHAKAMLVDHTVAAVGSANFDMRSLFLNYEIVQFLYAADDIQQLHAWFETKFIESEFGIPTPTVARSVSEGIARAFSPMF
ncbi:MAG: phospholipase D-like domain-containing protein, partial [Rubripirellula sp.]